MFSSDPFPEAQVLRVPVLLIPRSSHGNGAEKNSRVVIEKQAKRNPPGLGKSVLMYGELHELALYRADVLQQMGLKVILPGSKTEAVDLIRSANFHLAILSYTLPSETVKELADLIRQSCPQCPLLTISCGARHDPHVQPDAVIPSELGPAGLKSVLRDILGIQ